jgi:2-hydroxycyclohexanecarboxyl-CoA dehydrogenase
MAVVHQTSSPQIVLLVGCGHGIGRAAAQIIRARGHVLAACDKDVAALAELQSELGDDPDMLMTGAVDVTDGAAVEAFVAQVVERFGRIDSAICNAGGMISLVAEGTVSTNIRNFLDVPTTDWARIIDLNLVGPMNVAHAVLPHMVSQGSGRVVLVSSASALVGGAGLAVYAAAKGGVVAFTKSLAREVARSGIAVNSVAPGGVATRAFPKDSPSVAKRTERIAMGRLGEPSEVADVIAYVALDAPTYLTGEVISVAGGPP